MNDTHVSSHTHHVVATYIDLLPLQVSQVRLDTVLSQEAYLLFYIKDPAYRSSPTSYTCTMVTEPAESSQVSHTHFWNVTICMQCCRLKQQLEH